MRTLPFAIAVIVFLAGCGDPKPKGRLQPDPKRVALMEKQLDGPAKSRAYAVGANQLFVVDVPVQSGRVFVERQRCFVWRDAEFKTSSLSCESNPSLDAESLADAQK